MSTQLESAQPRHTTRNIVLTAITIAILAGIFFGGSFLWQKRFGASQATSADCRTAQAVIDKAQSIPTEKAARDASYKAYRAQWATIDDGYLQADVSGYVGGAYALAEGQPNERSKAGFQKMVDGANSHCDQTIVMPPYKPAPTR
jgi:hypothetical protein